MNVNRNAAAQAAANNDNGGDELENQFIMRLPSTATVCIHI